MTNLAKLADQVNSFLGKEQRNKLMRGMNPDGPTKDESSLGCEVQEFDDMIDIMRNDGGFRSRNSRYFRSDPNATDSPEIAASYAAGGSSDYLLMVFDEEVDSYHMFGREYHVAKAGWTDIDQLVAAGSNLRVLEDLGEEYNIELVLTAEAPEEYVEMVGRPDGVTDEKSGRWYDLMYTLEDEVV